MQTARVRSCFAVISAGQLLCLCFPRARLHKGPEVYNGFWLLLWSRGDMRDRATDGHGSFGESSV